MNTSFTETLKRRDAALKPYSCWIYLWVVPADITPRYKDANEARAETRKWVAANRPFLPFINDEKGARPVCNKSYYLSDIESYGTELQMKANLRCVDLKEAKEMSKHLADAVRVHVLLSGIVPTTPPWRFNIDTICRFHQAEFSNQEVI